MSSLEGDQGIGQAQNQGGANPNGGPTTPIVTPTNTAVPPPVSTPSSHVHVHYSNTPVPKFDGNSDVFGTWKARMLLHFSGIERYMLKILKEGPYVPMTPVSPVLDPTGSRRGREKTEDHWSEEERRLVDLDTKLKNMILSAVPESLIPILVLFPSAKTMWEELLIQFEGGDDTIVTRKVALTKKYETFFALPNESLTDTYTRFTNLINQLRGLGVDKDKEILLEKFCDILPSKWSHMILVLRQSKTLHSHTLASLYGAFRFTEENNAQRVMAEQDALNHASSSRVVSKSEPPCAALLSSESVQSHSVKKVMSELMNSGISDVVDSCEETDNDDLVAMIAKTFNRFKAKSNRFHGQPSSSSSNDKANLTCFKCGKKGHFMKECRSSQSVTQSGPSQSFTKPDDSYKLKYKKLKAQIALMSLESQKKNECMMATNERWEYSDDSSDDDEEIRDMCFMALEDQQHLVKDDVTSGRWVDIILKKVCDFDTETDPERKMDLAELLNCDLVFVETVRTESLKLLETDFNELSACQAQLKELKDIHLAYQAQVIATETLEQEKLELVKIIEKEKKVLDSWVKTKRPFDAAVNQFPTQKNAYLDGNLHVASIVPDLHDLPSEIRPETPYDVPNVAITEAKKAKAPQTKTEAAQTTAPVKKVNLKKPSQSDASTSKEPKTPKKKNVSLSEPKGKAAGKAQVNNQESILLKLVNQVDLLARQVQSCNARLNNFEGTSSTPKQNTKPFSKKQKDQTGVKSSKKKGQSIKPVVFVESEANKNVSDIASTSNVQKSEGTNQGGSSEPISGWVPKTN